MQNDFSIWAIYQHADIVVKGVIISLLCASVITWALFFIKYYALIRLRVRLQREQQRLHSAANIDIALQAFAADTTQSHIGELLRVAQHEIALSTHIQNDKTVGEHIQIRLERTVAALGRQLGWGNGFFATVGAIAPFVGLFGTVWGIMDSFIGIAKLQTTNLAVVAPGIAEALLATAVGLVAAIPAVIIYNLCVRNITSYRASLGDIAVHIILLQSRNACQQAPTQALVNDQRDA